MRTITPEIRMYAQQLSNNNHSSKPKNTATPRGGGGGGGQEERTPLFRLPTTNQRWPPNATASGPQHIVPPPPTQPAPANQPSVVPPQVPANRPPALKPKPKLNMYKALYGYEK